MAAEFRLLIDRIVHKHQQQIQELTIKQQKCYEQVDSLYKNDKKIRQSLLEECDKDVNNFNSYLTQYKQQYVNSLTDICYEQLKQLEYNSQQYQDNKRKCLQTQIEGSLVFEQNILSKLSCYN